MPPLEVSRLRETLSRRRHFVRLQTSEVNAAKRLLRSTGLGQLGRSLGTEAGWEKLERSLKEKDETLAMYVGQHRLVWRSARDQVEALEQALEVQQAPFAEQLEPVAGPASARVCSHCCTVRPPPLDEILTRFAGNCRVLCRRTPASYRRDRRNFSYLCARRSWPVPCSAPS